MVYMFDEFMAWPYVEPYGMVAAPKPPKVKKPRKSRAKPDWLKEINKKARRQLREELKQKSRTQRRTFSDPMEVFLPKE
jgi:hypothetical protein